eukprot:CAMPEP_0116824266 /NCGR_PEP_ID=MMETSP0418-20121206/1299_1 /TAXON_ID=1158023 /ORGANISM="Astrosyne radiata, Strain 13vi08-1A" /LENGTH=93 /DNA_ID=CAMNT_0004452613 /DNA_START=635 /DNA_END=916 /DNA_ORIENTATION=+
MSITIPLMHDGTDAPVPIGDESRREIVNAQIHELEFSECTEIVDGTLALGKDPYGGNLRCGQQFVGVIQVIVKSLIGTLHENVRLVPFVHHGP